MWPKWYKDSSDYIQNKAIHVWDIYFDVEEN